MESKVSHFELTNVIVGKVAYFLAAVTLGAYSFETIVK